MNRWLKCLAALAMSVALVAAPCKNCEPKVVKAEAQKCQHDCCPKPKPEQPNCKWQPADYSAVEAKQEAPSAPQANLEILASHAAPAVIEQPQVLAPQAQAEPPPLYLTHKQLRN